MTTPSDSLINHSMITKSDALMAAHELEAFGKDWLLVKQCGWQEGFGGAPGRMLYNVVAGAYTIGSTVCAETLIAAGYRIEIV